MRIFLPLARPLSDLRTSCRPPSQRRQSECSQSMQCLVVIVSSQNPVDVANPPLALSPTPCTCQTQRSVSERLEGAEAQRGDLMRELEDAKAAIVEASLHPLLALDPLSQMLTPTAFLLLWLGTGGRPAVKAARGCCQCSRSPCPTSRCQRDAAHAAEHHVVSAGPSQRNAVQHQVQSCVVATRSGQLSRSDHGVGS